jgi:NADH-quinone oxidoreductase subunit C
VGTLSFATLQERVGPLARDMVQGVDMPVLSVPREGLVPLVQVLRNELAFDLLLDITAVDWPGEPERFEVVYHFYSTAYLTRVRVKAGVTEADAAIDTLTALYGSAAYAERECHEMFGIAFRGNADLRPILLYEGFVGHPLRKDYAKEHEQPLVPYRPASIS